jgi:hypothetical protein
MIADCAGQCELCDEVEVAGEHAHTEDCPQRRLHLLVDVLAASTMVLSAGAVVANRNPDWFTQPIGVFVDLSIGKFNYGA